MASCGLDRFLRIHHVDTRQLVDKVKLKTETFPVHQNKIDFAIPKHSIFYLDIFKVKAEVSALFQSIQTGNVDLANCR